MSPARTPFLLGALAVGLCVSSGAARAADPDGKRFPPREGSFGVILENDAFASGSDRNYSNGIQLNLRGAYSDAPSLVRWLGRNLQALNGMQPQSYGVALGHLIYTPEDIEAPIAPPDQHPYAGFLYLQNSFVMERDNEIRSVDLTVGLVGPSAGGEWLQSNFHALIGAGDPKGWDSQLKDEVAFAVDLDRRWRYPLTKSSGAMQADFSPNVGVSLGTLRTEAKAGGSLRLGSGLSNDFGPPRIRPSLSGAGLARAEPGIRAYGFAGFYARLVARDLFLDGNTFRDSARVDHTWVVGDLQAGLVVQRGPAALAYTYVVRSPEYETQDDPQQFGAFTVNWRW